MSLAKLMCSRFKGIKGVIQVAAAAQEKSNTAFPNTIADQFRWLYRLKVGRYYGYVSKFLYNMIFPANVVLSSSRNPKSLESLASGRSKNFYSLWLMRFSGV